MLPHACPTQSRRWIWAALDDLVHATDVLAQEALRFALASHENRSLLVDLRRQAQAFDSDANNALTPADDHIDLAH